MLTVLVRSILIYVFLVFMMRILGKRQIGELETTELVTTLLLSEIATMPITDNNIPFTFALIPMITIMSIEVFTSYILIKIPRLRRIISSTPSVIINRGELNQAELKKQRISIEELIGEIRAAGYTSLSDIYYAIVEENGTMTVIPKAQSRPLTTGDVDLAVKESGLMHIIISDGYIDKNGLSTAKKDKAWLEKQLQSKCIKARDVYLFLLDDADNITIIMKEGAKK